VAPVQRLLRAVAELKDPTAGPGTVYADPFLGLQALEWPWEPGRPAQRNLFEKRHLQLVWLVPVGTCLLPVQQAQE
jgi:hypothetical protein